MHASCIQYKVLMRKIIERGYSFIKAPQGSIALVVSERIVSPGGGGGRGRKKEKTEEKKKTICLTYNHLLTQFSVVVILKHHFLDWSLMGRECYKENI